MANDFNILAGVQLDTKSIQSQLDAIKNKTINVGVKVDGAGGVGELENATRAASSAAEDMGLTYQVANQIFRTSIDIIQSMAQETLNLNEATIEFQKVSDLTGASLENYTSKLADMGQQVARTGEPKCLSLNVRMVNVH